MEVRSIYKYARISPKKARDVAREIQGLPVSDAIDTLNFTPKKAAFLIGKTLKSAVANAENNHDLAADSLLVKEANISDGPSFRRFKPRARGSASAIKKRTSHIYIILTDEGAEEKAPSKREQGNRKKPAAKAEKVKEEAASDESVTDSAESELVAEDQVDADPVKEASDHSPDEETGTEQVTEEPPTPEEESEEEEQKD
ncbi:MAG: 50S ribosomal protein L22 [Roseibacillus sp.]